ncbi:hypothetical protein HPB52_019707 [Rhipicephalus sanguineus]|uniref:Reverse transcriptase domain-containing protein n=1 Tax=Rhipicephalus sanguineus TaxID=34632 RepID=A0A9D4QAL1_RHISA|nr:hypothetical protein HPB52_019707 [Rhipicephalus sanguineus]
MVPKPKKPIAVGKLRPLSLTSCARKLFECGTPERLTSHIEYNGYYPYYPYGLRQLISTQHVLLLLKEGLVDFLSKHNKSSVLAINVKSTFDNFSH